MKYNTEIFIYTDGNILLNEICEEKESIDVLMLDIDMPHISGLQIANEIRKRKLNITLIFVSAHDEMVFDAIQYQPFRYMRKTRLDEEMPQVLEDVFELLKDKDDKYTIIKTDEGNKKIKNSEIMHIEVDKQKIYLNHYPFLCFDGGYKDVWQLFGHVHTRKNNTGIDAARLQYLYPTQYDVGVDNNNFMPVSFAQMKIIIEKQVEQLKMKEQ